MSDYHDRRLARRLAEDPGFRAGYERERERILKADERDSTLWQDWLAMWPIWSFGIAWLVMMLIVLA